MSEHQDAALAVERAMTDEQRQRFLQHFFAANPSWRGAQVADVLSEMDNTDANLTVVERLLEDNADLPPAAATVIRALYWAGPDVTVEAVRDLLKRAGLA